MNSAAEFPESALSSLSPVNQVVVTRLLQHKPEITDLSVFRTSRLAGVLILLYEKSGQIRVLLTTRSRQLRSHPGQTALPGGRFDEADGDFEETAFREAHEEVALPRHSPHIFVLCRLRPFVSLYKIIVTPIVAFLTDQSVLETLVPAAAEVDRIFDHPLEAILDPSLSATLDLVPKGSQDWPYQEELCNSSDHAWLGETPYRMHRFRSTASPVKGLTADILTKLAEVAYDRTTTYERWAPGQPQTWEATQSILLRHEEAEKLKATETARAANEALINGMEV